MSIFVISESCCGNANTSFLKSSDIVHIKRHLLLKHRFNTYFCTYFNLNESPEYALLAAVLLARQSVTIDRYGTQRGWDGNHKPDSSNINTLSKYFNSSSSDIIAALPKSDIDKLFTYAFTGGFGEQSGNPGKEWNTITITEFDESLIQTIEPLKKKTMN